MAGSLSMPLPDPWLGLAEVLILLLAPVLVLLAAFLHAHTEGSRRAWSLAAFGWTSGAMTVTTTVHLVELTIELARSLRTPASDSTESRPRRRGSRARGR